MWLPFAKRLSGSKVRFFAKQSDSNWSTANPMRMIAGNLEAGFGNSNFESFPATQKPKNLKHLDNIAVL